MVLGVSGRVDQAEPSPAPDVEGRAVDGRHHAAGFDRDHPPVEVVEQGAVDPCRRGDQPAGSARWRAPFWCTTTVAAGKARATSPTPPAWSR